MLSVIPGSFHSGTLSRVILLHFTFIFSSLSLWCFDICRVDITITFLFFVKNKICIIWPYQNWLDIFLNTVDRCMLTCFACVVSSSYFKHLLSGVFCNIPAAHSWSNIRPNIKTLSQPAITCSKSTIETLVQGVKYIQS